MNKIPESVNSRIINDIKARLNPSLSHLLAKLFFIHFFTAVLTLAICPQFGFKAFKVPVNLMNSFMVFGMPFCNLLCGLFFTATSMLVATVILKRDEIRALKYKKIAATSSLILISIGFFSVMNPNIFLEFSFMWLIGAVLGVVLTLELSNRILIKA